MDRVNPVIGAFCTPAPDVARAQAKAMVEAGHHGGKAGWGCSPVGCRDRHQGFGLHQRHQDPRPDRIVYKDYVPTEDDVVVERLKAAGAIILGKTNVPEFGYSGASYNLISPPTNVRGTLKTHRRRIERRLGCGSGRRSRSDGNW